MNITRLLAVAGLGVIILAGCSAEPSPTITVTETRTATASPAPATLDVQVRIGVSAAHAIVSDDLCAGYGSYSAFNDDELQGIVKDATGAIVATGTFNEAQPLDDTGCVRYFDTTVEGDSDYFTVEVGLFTSQVVDRASVESSGSISFILDAS